MHRRSITSAASNSLISACLLVLTACSGSQQGTDPGSMSYEEHLAAADRERSRAERLDRESDRSAVEVEGQMITYQDYGTMATQHRAHAQAHREAAAALGEMEVVACMDAPEEARSTCPLTAAEAPVDIENLPSGVRMLLPTDDTESVRASVDCHSAHAAYVGFEGMPECVFYLPDIAVDVQATDDGLTELTITSDEPQIVEEIRRRVAMDTSSDGP